MAPPDVQASAALVPDVHSVCATAPTDVQAVKFIFDS